MAKKPAKPAKKAKVAKQNPQPKLEVKPRARQAVSRLSSEEAFRPPAYQRGNFGMPKRMCPFCNSTDVYPDSVGGDIMSWTCRSCQNSFPAPLEAPRGKHESDEDSEYEEMPD